MALIHSWSYQVIHNKSFASFCIDWYRNSYVLLMRLNHLLLDCSCACRMRVRQGICVLRQGTLGHFRPLLDIFREKGLFKDTFLFEGWGCISPPPLDAHLDCVGISSLILIFSYMPRTPRGASKGGGWYIPCPRKEKCLWKGLLPRKCLMKV